MRALLFALILGTTASFAQDSLFSKVYHTGTIDLKGQSVAESGDGGLVITGQYNWTQSAVFRIDSLGNTLWGKNLAASTGVVQWDNVSIKTIETLQDSSYMIAGECISADGTKLHAICAKISLNGDTLWTRTLTNPNMQYNTYVSASSTTDSGVVLVAKTRTSTSTGYFIVKYAANGDLLWSKVVEGLAVTDTPCAIQSLADSTTVVSVPNGQNECVILHLLSDGSLDWAQRIPDLTILDIEQVDSTAVMVGRSISTYNTALVKMAQDGTIQWSKNYSTNFSGGELIDVCVRQDSSFVITSGEQGFQGYAIATDRNGVATLQLELALASFAVKSSANNGVYIVGNGPMYGIKAGFLMTNFHIGVVRADSIFATYNGGFWPNCSWGVWPTTSSDLAIFPVPFSPQFLGTISPVSAVYQYNDLIPDSYIGCVDFFGGIEENSIEKEIKIFPNPSSGVFHIEQLSQHSLEIEISDINGRSIENKTMHTLQETIDLSAQKPGIYFYNVRRDDGQVKSGKLVILH